MLMLLNSRCSSMMKGLLRDLIEVSVGQTIGGFIQPGISFTSHSQRGTGKVVEDYSLVLVLRLTHREGSFRNQIQNESAESDRGWRQLGGAAVTVGEIQRQGDKEEKACVGFKGMGGWPGDWQNG